MIRGFLPIFVWALIIMRKDATAETFNYPECIAALPQNFLDSTAKKALRR